MKALLWKEWRQAGPAHVLVGLVIAVPLLLALPPEKVLLPSDWDTFRLYLIWALVAIAEGFLVGLLQHARERGRGAEAYLVHRASGFMRAFVARTLCGSAALGLAISVPPLAYLLWHSVLLPAVERPLNERLGHFLVVGACSLPAYGLGSFIAQLRGRWWSRLLLGIAGCLTLLFAAAVASQTPANATQTPIGPYLAVQLVLAGVLLTGAFCLFQAGDDEARPWPRRQALAAAAILLPLVFLPSSLIVAWMQTNCRLLLFETYPQIVEAADRALYVASRLSLDASEPKSWSPPRFEFQDAKGRLLQDDQFQRYDGYGLDFDPVLTIFDPSWTPLASDHPPTDTIPELQYRTPFGFDGAWIPLRVADEWRRSCWLRSRDGSIHTVDLNPASDTDVEPMPRHDVLARPDTGKGFSQRVLVDAAWPRPPLGGSSTPLLIDLEDRTFWRVDSSAAGIQIERVWLPGNVELAGLERHHSLARLRAGLYESSEYFDHVSLLLVGQEGRYVWTSYGFEPVIDREQLAVDFDRHVVPQSEASEVIAWRLEPSHVDGLGFQLDVFDVKTNQVELSHDFRPQSAGQRRLASLAWMSSLLRAPAGSLWSYLGAGFDPRNVTRLEVSYLRDPLLLDGAHSFLLWVSTALGCVLAISARRRIGSDPRERAVRWSWTLAVFALGVPAWLLCRLLEPSRRQLAVRLLERRAVARPMIQSSRSSSALQPMMSNV
jgi:hypothetical protein